MDGRHQIGGLKKRVQEPIDLSDAQSRNQVGAFEDFFVLERQCHRDVDAEGFRSPIWEDSIAAAIPTDIVYANRWVNLRSRVASSGSDLLNQTASK